MAVYFVASNGDDGNFGERATDAFRTVTRAKEVATDGDVVVMMDRPHEDGYECATRSDKKWTKGVYTGPSNRVLCVRSDGDDENAGNGDNSGKALRTIARALEIAGPGDRVSIPVEMLRRILSGTPSSSAGAVNRPGQVTAHGDQPHVFVEDRIGRP